MILFLCTTSKLCVFHQYPSLSLSPHTHTLPQMNDPCDPNNQTLGVTDFTFTLTVTTLDDTTTGFYTATFTNPGGNDSVTETFVTPYSES